MKALSVKLLLLGTYLITVNLVWSTPDMFNGVFALTVKGALVYCGIIVVAHLLSSLVQFCRWCLGFNRASCCDDYSSATVALETEAT